jgi:hypothetical protein
MVVSRWEAPPEFPLLKVSYDVFCERDILSEEIVEVV